ncbi:MAG: PAS domain S-box protein [Chloroflexi bacterium]|nr:PAS domain S-box protein [Chloroflexota bacterium]
MSLDLERELKQPVDQYAAPLLAVLVLVVLFYVSRVNYLLFHVTAELFSVVIAATTFVLTWNAQRFLRNGYLLFIGISLLFVGAIDTLHTLAYGNMGLFSGDTRNLATQLWLSARFVQSSALAIAPLYFYRQFRAYRIVFGFTVVTGLLLLSIFVWQNFPAAFIPGQEPTPLSPFKIAGEYLVILLNLIGGWLLIRNRSALDEDVVRLLIASLALNVVAEYFFTRYLSVVDLRNLFGHFFKIVSFYLIYKAIIQTAFLKPQKLHFRELAQREIELRASELRERSRAQEMEAMMDAVPAAVWIAKDPKAEWVTGNRAAAEMLRVPEGSNLSKTAPGGEALRHFTVYDTNWNEIPPEQLPLQISARTGKPVRDFEEIVLFNDGTEKRLYGNVTPLLDDNGNPAGAVAAFIDITERVRTEQALMESEQRYRSLFETIAEGFAIFELVFDEQGQPVDIRILEMNPAYEVMMGLNRAEHQGKRYQDIKPGYYSPWLPIFALANKTGQTHRHEDFSPFAGKYLDVLATPVRPGVVSALVIDNTERRKHQEVLRQNEARMRRLVESNIIGIALFDEDGSIGIANDQFLDIIGYTREDFEAGLVRWTELTPPEYRQLDDKGIAEARDRGACTPYEKEYFRKDGSRVPVLMGYAYLPDSAMPFISFTVDLTEQKKAEASVREYAAQLERSNRELQDFAFVASHDLQEPLRKIQAFGDRLRFNLKDTADEESADYLNRMLKAAGRMQSMINDLLSLSRVVTRGKPFERVDMNKIAREVLSDLEIRIEQSGGKVQVSELPEVEADPTQMRQLLQNLIGNALKFHKDDVPPVVKVSGACLKDSNEVQVIVEDNGIGFEAEYSERIFQPFQRLHGLGQYEGSGVGLAICRKIVERHSGTITVESTPGRGSTFIVTLPEIQASRR